MHRNEMIIAAFLLSTVMFFSASAAVETPFEVGTWGNFCQAAISHTFDDGTGNQYSKAVPLFKSKGFNMTLFTVTSGGMFPGWDKAKNAFSQGDEIGSHSVTHPGTVSDAECKTSWEAITKNVPGEKCISIAYPNCNIPTSTTNLKTYYIAGRICSGQIENKTPGDFYKISSIIVGQNGASTDMDGQANSAASKNGWAVFLHHGVDGDHSFASTSSTALGNHLNFLSQNKSKFWVETFGNVARYIKERDAVSLSVQSSTENSITVSITDNLPDTIYNYPLTIRRPLPDGWTTAVVTQNGKSVDGSIVTVNAKQYVMFKAVPNGGTVVISKEPTSVISHVSRQSVKPTISLNNSVLMINPERFSGSAIEVSLFNLNGATIGRYTFAKGSGLFSVPVTYLTNSAFFIKATDGITTVTSRCLKQM